MYFLFCKKQFLGLSNSSGYANAKSLQLQGVSLLTPPPDQRLCPWTTLGAFPQSSITGSSSAFTVWIRQLPLSQSTICTGSSTVVYFVFLRIIIVIFNRITAQQGVSNNNNNNKSAQSNLRGGPCRGGLQPACVNVRAVASSAPWRSFINM